MLDLAGGEAVTLTDFGLGAGELDWTADGSALVVAGTEWRPGWDDRDDDERARQPRRIHELGYRWDDRGWVHDRVTRVWVVDPDGDQETRALTPADHSVAGLAVVGDQVVFASPRHDERETEPGVPLWRVPLEGGEHRVLLLVDVNVSSNHGDHCAIAAGSAASIIGSSRIFALRLQADVTRCAPLLAAIELHR